VETAPRRSSLPPTKEALLIRFMRWGLALAALAFASLTAAAPASAQGYNWTGPFVGIQTGALDFDVDWVNPGTPEQEIRGAFFGVNAGFDFQIPDTPIVFGVVADASWSNAQVCVRDGNYIVECGQVNATGTFRARLGFAFDRVLIYATAGVGWAHMTQGQSCPNPAAVVAGWCKTHGPYDLTTDGVLWGPVWGGGIEVAVGDEGRGTIFAEVLRTNYGDHNFVMGPDGIGATLPDQIVVGRSTEFRIGFRWRF